MIVGARFEPMKGMKYDGNENQSFPMEKLCVTNEIPKGIVSQRISRKCSGTIGDFCTQISFHSA